MALVAVLTVLMALLPAGLASNSKFRSPPVTCTEGNSSQQTEVTAAATVVAVLCPESWTIAPPVTSNPEVCEDAHCAAKVSLSDYFKNAKAEDGTESKLGMKMTFGELSGTRTTSKLNCDKAHNGEKCRVEVILNKPATGYPDAVLQPPSGSDTPSIQICKQPNASITLKPPEKGSSARFACDTGFDLYPKDANKIFSKDCKKEETVSAMTRTDTPAAEKATDSASEPSQPYTYTFKADKKPSKKTLYYLCAKHETTAEEPGTAANYCTVYVESGARTQLDLNFTFVLALP